MKWICVLFLIAAACFASDFTNGQAARLVIGQTSFTAADPNSSNTIIGGASGVAYAADTLFIADDNRIGAVPDNNRVLILPNLSGSFPALRVIGVQLAVPDLRGHGFGGSRAARFHHHYHQLNHHAEQSAPAHGGRIRWRALSGGGYQPQPRDDLEPHPYDE